MKRSLLTLFLFVSLASAASAQEIITLDNYLQRVETENPDIIAVNHSIEAAWQKVLEADMAYSPVLTGGYSYTDDKSGAAFGSTLATKQMQADALSVNASKKFDTGTSVSLGYVSAKAAYDLYSPLSYNGVNYMNFTGYQIEPSLQLSQSLLRDFGGGLTQSGINKAKAAARAGQYLLLYKRQQLLIKARNAYWNLSLDREVLDFRQASLDRAEKLLKWNENKAKLDLIDESDLLQTQAAYKLRQLNLQLSREDVTKASREFNEMLGIKSDETSEQLEKISDKISTFSNVETLSKTGKRADVLASESTYNGAKFAEIETKYRAMPELSFNGSYSLNGLALSYSDAMDQVTNQDKPVYTLGLSFAVPLDFGTLRKVRRGYTNDFAASKDTFRSAELAAENDWNQLQMNWKNVKSRLELAMQIRDIQEARIKNEQNRLERGRTTTFQVLSAENDLDDSTLSVYRMIFEELMTYAQADLYNTKPIE
jgi:outer membrane protein TolC